MIVKDETGVGPKTNEKEVFRKKIAKYDKKLSEIFLEDRKKQF